MLPECWVLRTRYAPWDPLLHYLGFHWSDSWGQGRGSQSFVAQEMWCLPRKYWNSGQQWHWELKKIYISHVSKISMVGESKWVFKKSKLNKPKINVAQILPRGPIEGRLCLVAPTGVRDSTLKKKQKRNENENFSHYLITTY